MWSPGEAGNDFGLCIPRGAGKCLVCSGLHDRASQTGSLNNRCPCSRTCGGWKSKVKVGLVSSKASLLDW